MCSIAYEKMPETSATPVSITRRLQKVDVHVYFFLFVATTCAYDVTKLDYVLQWGVNVYTVAVFVELLIDAFLMFAAITRHVTALRVVKVCSVTYLIALSIVAVMAPVWMVFNFSSGAPEVVRLALEHAIHTQMSTLQRVAYCFAGEIYLLFDVIYYATLVYLARKMIGLAEQQRKEPAAVAVEMHSFQVV